jgi:hypothetical protein
LPLKKVKNMHGSQLPPSLDGGEEAAIFISPSKDGGN